MKKKNGRAAIWMIAALLFAMLTATVVLVIIRRPVRNTGNEPATEDSLTEQTALPVIRAETDEDGNTVFSLTLDSFIEAFNTCCLQTQSQPYLRPSSDWRQNEVERAPHGQGKTVIYNFTRDENDWALPTLSAYVPAGGERISEVTLNFDDHSYTPELFDEYKELSLCALRLFCPDLPAQDAEALFREMIAFADHNILPETQWYGADSVPQTVYCFADAGVYPYFAFGDWLRICFVPLDEQRRAEFGRSVRDQM